MLYSFIVASAPAPILFELHLSATAAGTHHLDERNRDFFFFVFFFNVGGTFKLHESVIVL